MIEKGGESMSLEAMKQVTEAEEANRARRAEAQAEAKRLVAEAERAGKARLAEARAQAEAQARELMRQAEATPCGPRRRPAWRTPLRAS